jgi:prepilin-type processing-associated H-X9-DG protein
MHVNSFFIGTAGGINMPTCPDEPGYNRKTCNNETSWGTSQAFKSMHPGGAQVVFCDASVQLIHQEIDYVSLQRLGDRGDGGVAGPF